MSDLVSKWAGVQGRRKPKPQEKPLHPDESRALGTLQREAKDQGAELANGGKGGLPPSLVLGVFRRDKYHCKKCGLKKNLGVHHKGGIVESKWLSKKGHHNDPNNVVVMCGKCHDDIHQQAKKEGVDASQVKPAGDDFKGQHGHD